MQKNGTINWPSISQLIPISEITNGETYTISVLSKGTAKWRLSFSYDDYSSNDNSQTWIGSGSQLSLHTFTAKIQITTGDIMVVSITIDGSSAQGDYLDIIAAKLELGPVQTLARQDADGNWVLNDPPPNFQQELAKCQRYLLMGNLEAPFLSGNKVFLSVSGTRDIIPSIIGTPRVLTTDNNSNVPDAVISLQDQPFKNGVVFTISGTASQCYIFFPLGSGLSWEL